MINNNTFQLKMIIIHNFNYGNILIVRFFTVNNSDADKKRKRYKCYEDPRRYIIR